MPRRARGTSPGDDRREHHEHHDRAEARGEHVVPGDRDRIGRHDRQRFDAGVRIGRTNDRQPGDRGEQGLDGLEAEPQSHVLGVDGGQRVPERREPALDVDAEEVQDEKHQHDRREPGDDEDDATEDGGRRRLAGAARRALSRPRSRHGQTSTQRRKPPRNASSFAPRRQFGGSFPTSRRSRRRGRRTRARAPPRGARSSRARPFASACSPSSLASPLADVVLERRLAEREVGELHRLEDPVDDHRRAEAGAEPEEEHASALRSCRAPASPRR